MKPWKTIPIVLSLVAIHLWPHAAMAAGPYVVDDADIVEADKIQSEDWFTHTDKGENIGIVNMAYQLLPHAEFTLQETHDQQKGSSSDTLSPQVKYQWREGDDNGRIASSIVVGTTSTVDQARGTGVYAYVPATLKLNKALDIDLNLGWQYNGPSQHHTASWGIGGEYAMTEGLSLRSDVFGQNAAAPGFQFGPHANITDYLEGNLVYGYNVFSAHENSFTAALTFTF
jgi:hypothetical protein